jgi:hypothetical protein
MKKLSEILASNDAVITEKVYTNYNDFSTQHKKMYPSHTEVQIKAAWEKYLNADTTASIRSADKVDRAARANAWKAVFRGLREAEDVEPSDKTGETLTFLEDICEMADEIYNTLSEYDEIDDETHAIISQIYMSIDNAYESIDAKYDIQVDNDDYEVSESIVAEEAESLDEEIDMNRFKQLASTGLVSKEDLPKLILAMRSLDADKPLSLSQKDLINSTFQSLIAVITGDTSILTKVKSNVAKN